MPCDVSRHNQKAPLSWPQHRSSQTHQCQARVGVIGKGASTRKYCSVIHEISLAPVFSTFPKPHLYRPLGIQTKFAKQPSASPRWISNATSITSTPRGCTNSGRPPLTIKKKFLKRAMQCLPCSLSLAPKCRGKTSRVTARTLYRFHRLLVLNLPPSLRASRSHQRLNAR